MPADLPPRSADRPPVPPAPQHRGSHLRGLQGLMLGITALALVAIVVLPAAYPREPAPSLHVVLADPTLEHGGALEPERAALLLEAARDALERQMAGRRSLNAEVSKRGADAVTAARASDAQEALVFEVRCGRNDRPAAERREPCQGELQRVRAIDGIARWRQPLRFAGEDLRTVDSELRGAIQVAYLRHPMQAEPPRLWVEADDYLGYLEVRRRRAEGASPEGLIQRLEDVLEGSPRFADGHRLHGQLLALVERPEAAIEALRTAARIAPTDPRPLPLLADLLEAAGRAVDAAEVREALRRIEPSSDAERVTERP